MESSSDGDETTMKKAKRGMGWLEKSGSERDEFEKRKTKNRKATESARKTVKP